MIIYLFIIILFFCFIRSLFTKPKTPSNKPSARRNKESRPDLLDFDEFCDIMDEDNNEEGDR